MHISNDLRVAIEFKAASGDSWHVLYPESRLQHENSPDSQMDVRLRDASEIRGSTTAHTAGDLRVPRDFGDAFKDASAKHIQEEEEAAAEEARLRKQRQEELQRELHEKVQDSILRRQRRIVFSASLVTTLCLGFMIFFTVRAFLQSEPQLLQAVGLSLAWLGLCVCAFCSVGCGNAAVPSGADERKVQEAVGAARPELDGFQGKVEDEVGKTASIACFLCVPFVGFACLVAMTVAHGLSSLAVAIAALWCGLALLLSATFCFIACVAWSDNNWPEGVGAWLLWMLFAPTILPAVLLQRLLKLQRPPPSSLEQAVHATHQRTIVFEGNVLGGRPTVASWPGKYETAWDAVVAGSRRNDVSAAVVFLPEGSEDFGKHDRIPNRADLQDLRGTCWCTPLYGEEKPWGCRWWTRWIANVELAVNMGCTPEVYYFNGKKGRGKVQNFTTAGSEHKRREQISSKMKEFQETEGFQDALASGLQHLSKEKGPDSSSAYSREVQRLFLAWLPEDERQFLEESEGLGNSQKAEVAWLERKGYPFVEKEVSELEASSPKAIGRATEDGMPENSSV